MFSRWDRRASGFFSFGSHAFSIPTVPAAVRRLPTHIRDADVAAAGGWESPDTVRQSCQQADPETMYEVVTDGGQLREAQRKG